MYWQLGVGVEQISSLFVVRIKVARTDRGESFSQSRRVSKLCVDTKERTVFFGALSH